MKFYVLTFSIHFEQRVLKKLGLWHCDKTRMGPLTGFAFTGEKIVSKYIMFSFEGLHFPELLEREPSYVFSLLNFPCYIFFAF